MLTVSDDDQDLFAAIKNGAEGYLLKNLEPYQLFDMLEGVRRGEAPISGTLAAKILQEFRQPDQSTAPEPEARDELTPREIEVLERVVEGATNKEIAEALTITENTVKIHLRNILEKLHLHNRIQAAVYAVREGLVDDSSQTQ
jgi:DNA-binding NarL/FixJ family response regulator